MARVSSPEQPTAAGAIVNRRADVEREMSTVFTKTWRVGWAPVAVVASHSVLAAVLGHRRELDPVFHFLGGAAGALAVLNAIGLFPRRLSSLVEWNRGLVALAAVVLAALVWEGGEFVADRVLGSQIQAGWSDTLIDLALGVGGAAAAIFLLRFGSRHDHEPARLKPHR